MSLHIGTAMKRMSDAHKASQQSFIADGMKRLKKTAYIGGIRYADDAMKGLGYLDDLVRAGRTTGVQTATKTQRAVLTAQEMRAAKAAAQRKAAQAKPSPGGGTILDRPATKLADPSAVRATPAPAPAPKVQPAATPTPKAQPAPAPGPQLKPGPNVPQAPPMTPTPSLGTQAKSMVAPPGAQGGGIREGLADWRVARSGRKTQALNQKAGRVERVNAAATEQAAAQQRVDAALAARGGRGAPQHTFGAAPGAPGGGTPAKVSENVTNLAGSQAGATGQQAAAAAGDAAAGGAVTGAATSGVNATLGQNINAAKGTTPAQIWEWMKANKVPLGVGAGGLAVGSRILGGGRSRRGGGGAVVTY